MQVEPRPVAPLLSCPGLGQRDFGRFFESSVEKSFVQLDCSRTVAATAQQLAGQSDPGHLGRPMIPSISCFRPVAAEILPKMRLRALEPRGSLCQIYSNKVETRSKALGHPAFRIVPTAFREGQIKSGDSCKEAGKGRQLEREREREGNREGKRWGRG